MHCARLQCEQGDESHPGAHAGAGEAAMAGLCIASRSFIFSCSSYTDHASLTKAAFLLLQVAMVPGRERMLLYTRVEDMTDFDPKTKHSQEELDALRAKYPYAWPIQTRRFQRCTERLHGTSRSALLRTVE
eukprot:COSAG02_NODE_1502_length_12258_cov_12.486142_7_plen_131_part_00